MQVVNFYHVLYIFRLALAGASTATTPSEEPEQNTPLCTATRTTVVVVVARMFEPLSLKDADVYALAHALTQTPK